MKSAYCVEAISVIALIFDSLQGKNQIFEGHVTIPSTPGFGLQFDDAYLMRHIKETGWSV
jgi:hypothetical protein